MWVVFAFGALMTSNLVAFEEKDMFDANTGTFLADLAITNDYAEQRASKISEHLVLQGDT